MIIASFTTSPSRIHKCEKTVDSILNQEVAPDIVILNIPKKYRGESEYSIPEFLSDKVIVNVIENDLGPGTKVLGSLMYCNSNNITPEKLIYFDDDVVYPKGMIGSMLMCSEKGRVVGASCFDSFFNSQVGIFFHRSNVSHQVVEGFAGVCVDYKDLDGLLEYFESLPNTEEVLRSDDLYLSLFYHEKKCSIRPIDMPGVYSFVDLFSEGRILEYGNEGDALHNQEVSNVERYLYAARQISEIRNVSLPNLT